MVSVLIVTFFGNLTHRSGTGKINVAPLSISGMVLSHCSCNDGMCMTRTWRGGGVDRLRAAATAVPMGGLRLTPRRINVAAQSVY